MFEESHKERIIQEFVPGKQVTLAHVIPHPVEALYAKMGLIDAEGAIGIFTITPSEAAIIAADVASKAAGIQIGFVVVDGMSDGIKTFQCLLPPLLYHVRKKNALLCWIESAFVRKKRVGLPFLGKSTLIADCK